MNTVKTLFITLFYCTVLVTANANEIIPQDQITVATYDCDQTVDVCIDLPLSQYSDFQVTIEDQPYTGIIAGCNFDTIFNYTYSTLLGQGTMGPYQLDNWTINGQNFTTEFNTIDDLVAQMNIWDPNGNWTHNPNMMLIIGGAAGNSYSNMDVTALLNNMPSIIGLNFGLNPQGTQLAFTVGLYDLIFFDPINNCTDTLTINIECFSTPTNDTITNTIPANEFPYLSCIDTTELLGDVVSIENVCPDNAEGFVLFSIVEGELLDIIYY